MKKEHSIITDFSVLPNPTENKARLLVLMSHLHWLRNDAVWLNFQRSSRPVNLNPNVS
jgi:hypothetical protein